MSKIQDAFTGGTINVSNAQSRLQFSTETPISGEVIIRSSDNPNVAGPQFSSESVSLGRVDVDPGPNDPLSTDYVLFDPSRVPQSAVDNGFATVYVDGERAGRIDVNSADEFDPWTAGGSATRENSPNDSPVGPEPSDIAGVVNADNPDGAALAPALRRRGIEVDDVGTTATVQGQEFRIVDEGVVAIDGDRIEVDNIEDADEVARVTDGPNAGDPVPTDADVAPDGEAGGGVIGAVGVGLLALLAGAAALLGGDS